MQTDSIHGFRLSPLQEHLWQLQLDDRNFAYRACCAVLINGLLRIDALKEALAAVVERHEILRTTFRYVPDLKMPVQIISVQRANWADETICQSLDALESVFEDWRTGSPAEDIESQLRLRLLKVDQSNHVLLLSLPALCADTTAISNLVEEIARTYGAVIEGTDDPVSLLQYADIAEWQREWLQSPEHLDGAEYWSKLNIADSCDDRLVFRKSASECLSFQPAVFRTTLDVGLSKRIETIAGNLQTSPADFLLACWGILLAKLAGKSTIVVGLRVDGRSHDELKGSIGLFEKYTPVRVAVTSDSRFPQVLSEAGRSASEAARWQDYFQPSEIASANHRGEKPFCLPWAFDYSVEDSVYQVCDTVFSIVEKWVCTDRFAIKLSCISSAEGLSLQLHYDSSLFGKEEMALLSERLSVLIESACATPESKVDDLAIVGPLELQRILRDFSRTKPGYTPRLCLHDLVSDQAARTPHAIAAVFGSESLSYAELDHRSDQLARRLDAIGVGPESLVAVCMRRSPSLIVALLGVLKAGGAYVPLDPAYPLNRLDFMIRDSGAAVLLTESALMSTLPSIEGTLLFIDSDLSGFAGLETEPFRKPLSPENLAYVIYTSGSTGTPKGVAIQHSSAVALLEWACETYTADELSMVLASTSICFDLSVFEMFVPLSIGTTVVLCENILDLSALQQAQVTLINTVPSAMSALARIGGLPRSVRTVNLAGEALRGAVVRRAYEIGEIEKLYNLYGPSEDTTYSTYTLIEKENLDEPTIGQPVSNTSLYVLDRQLQPVPIGVEGEIYIAGQGLSRCYLNRPDITAERFLPDPFGSQNGARMYSTGDVARYLIDGNVDYVGRRDHQIKISGFRIELGEIEAVLARHRTVREVAVIVLEHKNGDKQLVAYFVAESDEQPSHEELRAYLRQYLPDYMLPAVFFPLNSLPLTANGKLDRRALPAPNQEAIVTRAPQNVIEKAIATIWAEVLQLSAVGVETDFFEIGGHSLLATQIVARVRDVFQYDMPLRVVFEARTVSAIAGAILSDGARRQELENSAQRFLCGEIAGPGLIQRRHRDGQPIPLSFAQQRIWFIDQLEPGITAYNLCGAVLLAGRIDQAALFKSFDELFRRQEVLRTSFPSVNGKPEQVIKPTHHLRVDQIDLSGHNDPDSDVLKALTDEALLPFDLSSGPLVRVKLLKLAEDRQVLLVTMHHIISDGWSIGIFIREFAALYNAFSSDRESPLAELNIQYADFAQWQREWLQGEVSEQQLEYWKKQLGGELPVIELPFDRPRPLVSSYRGAHLDLRIPSSVTEGLRSLTLQHGVTMFMAVVAAFQVLLFRYGGREDIIVGTPIANRNRSEIEGLIGFFTNTLVLRTDLSGRPSFITLLNRVRDVALAAYARQDLPFEKLVEELHPERDLSYHPVFQVMVVFQNTPMTTLDLEGLKLEPLEIPPQHSKFDLTLELSQDAEGLQGRIIYSLDLFDAATVERITDNFKTLLESIVSNPEALISDLSLLTNAEREKLLFEWNSTHAQYPEECIYRLIEASVEQFPNAIAAVCGDVQLTYGELNKRSNQLARYLRAHGVAAESRVGVCFEPGVNLLVALLGVMKSGGAYLPLDPAYPKDRLAFLIEDAQMSVVVAEECVRAAIPEELVMCVTVDGDWVAISEYQADNLSQSAEPEGSAYILYTSGSTGKPKGVIIEHRQLLNYVLGISRILDLPPGSRFAMVQPLTFDSCITAIYPSLVNGGVLHLIPRQVALDGEAISEYYAAHDIEYVKITPSHQEALMSGSHQPGKVLPKRCIIIGGERLSWDLVKRIRSAAPACEIRNHYGPTETTVGVVTRPVEDEMGTWASVPIGRPIPNVQLYILDQHMQPAPVGATGELYIGGSCLARGYLERPDLTAESFVPDPFGAKFGARLYRTGDIAHYLPWGETEFLRRADHQLKIRGFRIELGEIEAALRECRGVREVAVLAQEYAKAEKRLVAYVAVDNPATVSVDDLRNHLRSKLPAYMVPSAIVKLDKLPLNRRGKIDRQHLFELYREDRTRQEESVSYQTPVEEILAGIWAELLQVERVSRDDNFFELGGHSLLATQVVSHIRQALRSDLPLRSIFEAPVLADLARQIEARAQTTSVADLAPITKSQQETNFPLSFAQERLWILDQLDQATAAYNVPAAIQITGHLNLIALRKTLNEIVRRHAILRTTFQLKDGNPVQVVSDPEPMELPIIDLSGSSDRIEDGPQAQAYDLIREESSRPFDLSKGPLLRPVLIRLEAEQHILLMTRHHIVSDAWSTRVLVREATLLYESFLKGLPAVLAELPIQYYDFAVWQRQRLSGERIDRQLAYWRTKLDKSTAVLDLPTDRPRPPVQTYSGGIERTELRDGVYAALKALALEEGATLFMTVMSAFKALLQRYTNQEQISVGTPISGRTHREIEDLIGFFINTLVLSTQVEGGLSFRELIRREREVALSAYANQDLPFERLVGELQPVRSLSHSPLFQVMLLFQDERGMRAQLPDVSFNYLDVDTGTAKFDLTMIVSETEGHFSAGIEYNIDLFDATTIRRMLGHFEMLLEGVVAQPERPLWSIDLLTPSEQQQLTGWHKETARDYPNNICIHELFESQARLTPDAIAVVASEGRLSYERLNSEANRLAHHLRRLGVGPDSRVAICCSRRLELVIGMLGILKAGGAYVPVDPGYPEERCLFIIADSGADVLLTDGRVGDRYSEVVSCNVRLDSDWEVLSRESGSNLERNVDPANLAYIIYTSGSTGRPKGVAIEHRSAVSLLHWAREMFDDEELSGVLASTSICFDLSVFELFAPLSWGGAALIVENALRLADMPGVDEVKLINTVPSALEELLRLEAIPGSARVINLAGEVLQRGLAQQARQYGNVARVLNLYGPSEDTTYSTGAEVEKGSALQPSIGRAISNKRVYILDRHLAAVPVGVVGDVYIAGEGLARGYINRPELTAERFLPDCIIGQTGSRMYMTGDLGKYRENGEIEFLGRVDHQVKLRGFRIELGEIESTLAAQESIREAAVITREDRPGEMCLAAYVVPADGASLGVSELKAVLAAKLPEYMVPSRFVVLESLPRTPNGKVDRRSLPAPEPVAKTSRADNPRDIIELRLARVWQEVLGLDRVGLSDDFFDLGGYSLLAARLIAAVRKEFATDLPLAAIFHAPTVEGMARLLRGGRIPQNQVLVPIHARRSARHFFCVHAAGGSALAFVELARRIGDDITFYGFQSPLLSQQSNGHKTTIEGLAARYIEELRTVQPEGPYAIGGWSMGGVVAFEMARQLSKAGQHVSLLALIDSIAPTSNGKSPQANRLDVMAGVAQELGILEYLEYQGEQLESEQELTRLLERAKAEGLIPPELSPAHVSHLITVYSTNVEATFSYKPQTIPVKPTLFKASERLQENSIDPTLGWGTYCPKGVDVHLVPGNHFSIVREPGVQALAEKLRSSIYEAS